eukprot:TRINITY_DN798_c2_g2_i1.p1 TRINITY_DN798_c2_g2~~TRINITY_DN798_c2_g2_i1.p1  ORF type:complete len:460 (-),score=163.86 TRINITY_DN798_c2_g2_i1:19-1398(-)
MLKKIIFNSYRLNSSRKLCRNFSNFSSFVGKANQPLVNSTIYPYFSKEMNKNEYKDILYNEKLQQTYIGNEFGPLVYEYASGQTGGFDLQPGVSTISVIPINSHFITTILTSATSGYSLCPLNPFTGPATITKMMELLKVRTVFFQSEYESIDFSNLWIKYVPDIVYKMAGSFSPMERYPNFSNFISIDEPEYMCYAQYDQIGINVPNGSEIPFFEKLIVPDLPHIIRLQEDLNPISFSQSSILNNSLQVGSICEIDSKSRVCFATGPDPIVEAGLAPVLSGGASILPQSKQVKKLVKCLQDSRSTHLFTTINVLNNLILGATEFNNLNFLTHITIFANLKTEFDLSAIKSIFKNQKIQLFLSLPETGSFLVVTPDSPPNSVGQILPHTEVKIVNDKGEIVKNGSVGTICVKGYNISQGTYSEKKENIKPITDANGWFITNLKGTFDSNGNLFLSNTNN